MASFQDFRTSALNKSGFDVVTEFAKLDGARKIALFDHMNGSTKTFYNTVTMLWPQAKAQDCKKLERFLVQRMVANDA